MYGVSLSQFIVHIYALKTSVETCVSGGEEMKCVAVWVCRRLPIWCVCVAVLVMMLHDRSTSLHFKESFRWT